MATSNNHDRVTTCPMANGDGGGCHGPRRETSRGWQWQWAVLAALLSLPLLLPLTRRTTTPQLLLALAADSMGALLGGGQAQAQTPTTLVKSEPSRFSVSTASSSQGVKFTTGSKPARVTDVRVQVNTGNAGTVVRIREDGTNPTGKIVATLNNPSPFTNGAWNTFTAPANTVLAAKTTYWLVLNDGVNVTVPPTRMRYRSSSNDDETGVTGWSIANNSRILNDNTKTWGDWGSVPEFEIRGSEFTPPPTGLTATPGPSSGQVTLSWTNPNNSNITEYQYRQGSGDPLVWDSWTEIASSDKDTVSHTVSGLTNGTQYSFQVRAVAGTVNGASSDEVSATPVITLSLAPGGAVTVRENTDSEVVFTLRLDGTRSTDTSFRLLTVSGGTASENSDFIPGPFPLTIPAGETEITQSITILDDNYQESDETFNVFLYLANPPGDLVLDTSSATVTILDDDAPRVSFAAASSTVAESGGTQNVAVAISPAPTAEITVSYTVGGTAVEDTDFSITGSGTVTVPANTGSVNIPVAITDDNVDENGETVILTLSSGTGYNVGSVNVHTLTIADNDANNAPTVATAIPDQDATAGAAFSYAFPANTFADIDGDALGYTATQGDDSALPGWLSFTEGSRSFSGTPQAANVGTLSVKVTATDDNGGSVSDTFTITVSPAAPVGLVATPGPGAREVTLTWSNPNNNLITKYQYHVQERNDSPASYWRGWQDMPNSDADTVRFTVTHFTNSGNRLTAGFNHIFVIRAVAGPLNGAESAYAYATPPSAATLKAPTGLTAVTGPNSGEVTLRWDDPGNLAISGYQVRVAFDDNGVDRWGAWSAMAGSNHDTIRHVVKGLTADVLHAFTIRAVGGNQNDVHSPEATIVYATPPAANTLKAPTGLVATPGPNTDGATVTWDDPNNPVISGYETRIRRTGSNWSGRWISIIDSDASTVSTVFPALNGGGTFEMQLRAVAGAVKGPASPIVTLTPATAAVTLAAPVGLVATPGPGSGQVTLRWDDPNNKLISKYQYRVATDDNGVDNWGAWTDISPSNRNTVRYVITGLTPGSPVKVTIKAFAGSFVESPAATAVTVTPPSAATLKAPTGLTAVTGPNSGEVTLRWDDPGNLAISGYQVRVAFDDNGVDRWGAWSAMAGSNHDTIRHVVKGLTADVLHAFTIRAVGGNQNDVHSPEATIVYATPANDLPVVY
ncbi:MAG: fibronectin type III domain-containing protein, partial [Cyanobacteria bacterium MAG CAR3_bin_5]|nr:fibronectin type III domain-containing protein [Cyanobacteria bacterium MAG CAR3_bin_5]